MPKQKKKARDGRTGEKKKKKAGAVSSDAIRGVLIAASTLLLGVVIVCAGIVTRKVGGNVFLGYKIFMTILLVILIALAASLLKDRSKKNSAGAKLGEVKTRKNKFWKPINAVPYLRQVAYPSASIQAVLAGESEGSIGEKNFEREVPAKKPTTAAEVPWTETELVLLRNAAVSVGDRFGTIRERWIAAAEMVPNRSVGECIAAAQRHNIELKQHAVKMDSTFAASDSEDDDIWNDDSATSPIDVLDEDFLQPQAVVESRSSATRVGLTLRSPSLGFGFAQVGVIEIRCACQRCGTLQNVSLSGTSRARSYRKFSCETCSTGASHVALIPYVVHRLSHKLCHLDVEGVVVVDVLWLSLNAACVECGKRTTMPRVMPRANRMSREVCRSCHTKMHFSTGGVTIDDGSTPTSSARDREKKRKKKKMTGTKVRHVPIPFKAGNPLPNEGACKHFRRSKRWLRFDCCGVAFPCPVCHELSGCDRAVDGVIATHEICGRCCHERKISDEPCSKCGFKMGRNRGSGRHHWNGGHGSRDTTLLSRKDKRKHKGVSASGTKKTTSKKSMRVGARGKQERERKQKKKGKLP